jgi:hypothetical protein
MQIAGFTIIRNAIQYDYPVVESIRSVLPLVDCFFVSVGQSTDGTRALIESINDEKMVIIDSIWDENLREGGKVLSEETNKAFQKIPCYYDWVVYIQADELMHENDLPVIKMALEKWQDYPNIDGILFNYKHFYGSYDYIGVSPKWYRNEIRIIRNDKTIYSYRDAQGFRKGNNHKLMVKPVRADIFHYGWVRPPDKMQLKVRDFEKLWHKDEKTVTAKALDFDYQNIDALRKFEGSHPKVFLERVLKINWAFDFDPSFNRMNFKNRARVWFEEKMGLKIGYYKNYKIVKGS